MMSYTVCFPKKVYLNMLFTEKKKFTTSLFLGKIIDKDSFYLLDEETIINFTLKGRTSFQI